MRALVAKNIEKLVPQNPKVSHLSPRGVRRWKKDFWNRLNHYDREKRRILLLHV